MTPPLNPFADFGRPVGGARFVGREKALRTLRARVTDAAQPGNFALIGEARIGKSSIAHHGIRNQSEALLDRSRVPVWLNVGLFRNGWEIFQALADTVAKALKERNWLTPELDVYWQRVREHRDLTGESQLTVLDFFRAVRRADLTVVAVLDEFDNAAKLWSSDRPGFQLLREVSHDPDCAVSLVTTSRRELRDIELSSGVISTLAGTFLRHYVQPFDALESADVITRLAAAGVALLPSHVMAIHDVTGGHPLFMDMVCFQLIEAASDVVEVRSRIIESEAPAQFIDVYDQHVARMKQDGSLLKLLQILVGPIVDVTKFDVDRLMRYGTLRTAGDRYEVYSRHFDGYVRAIGRDSDPWPLWRDTERGIRRCIGAYLSERHGTPWTEALKIARPKMAVMIERWQEARDRETQKYGQYASVDLLDYSYPDEVFGVIRGDWSWFEPVFGGQLADWNARFQALARVRTPLAHNRLPESYRGVVEEATGICRQVLDRVGAWEAKRATGVGGVQCDEG